MSGIVAVFHRNGEPVEPVVVEAMLSACPGRTVDGQHTLVLGSVALAHQHFWITPEEQGEEQPLTASPGHPAITADVRLDNRSALIRALGLEIERGRHLSDAALILCAYERWGTDCVDYLLGDFAFVIWDEVRRQLFVGRDALGTRGICYYLDRDRCLIASEIKQILAYPSVQPCLNEGKVADFLAMLWDDQEETFYNSIYYCPPAHCLVISTESARKWRYWDIDPEARIRYRQDGEYGEHFRALLTEAVRCRLRATGAIGISLSGGLDSTSVAALAARHVTQASGQPGSLRSFSYIFDELSGCDERQYIEPLVDRYELQATYIPGDDKWPLRDLPDWPSDRDFVYHDPYVWLPVAIINAAEQAGCRLLLTGHFGDMLFLGASYWAADMLREFRLGQFLSAWVRNRRAINWRRDIFEHGLRPLIPARLRRVYRRLRPRPVLWPHPGLHPSLIERSGLLTRRATDGCSQAFSRPGQWQRYRRLTSSIHAQGMASAQNLYTSHGVERADPFCDRRLVEHVMAIPADQLGRPWCTRWVLRNAMDGLLPPSVRQRVGKTSFFQLFERGVRQRERRTVETLLQDAQILHRRFIRAEWLQEEMDANRIWSDYGYALWLCISLELWLRRYW